MADSTAYPVYRVRGWDRVFETADSRRQKTLNWISIPLGFDSDGFVKLIEDFGDDAPSIYGAWVALTVVAARCHVRGVLCTSAGEGFSPSRLVFLTRFPRSVFEKLIEWASSQRVGWLEVLPSDQVKIMLNGCQSVEKRSAIDLQDKTDKTKQDKTQPHPTRPSGGRSVVGGGDPVEGGGRVLGRSDFDPVPTEAVVELAKRLALPFALEQRQRGQVARLALAAGVRSGLLELARACGSTTVRSPSRYWQRGVVKLFAEAGVDFDASLQALEALSRDKVG
jgi:hypothetical protein